jgi:hypothetical protein
MCGIGRKRAPSCESVIPSSQGNERTMSGSKPVPKNTTPSRATNRSRGVSPIATCNRATGVRSVICTSSRSGKIFRMPTVSTCWSASTRALSLSRSSSNNETRGGNSSVRASQAWSSTPSRIVFNSGGRSGTAFASAGMRRGSSYSAPTIIHTPQPQPATNKTSARLRTPAMTSRQRPPLDMARAFTGWGISLQVRVAGEWVISVFTKVGQAKRPENAPTRA